MRSRTRRALRWSVAIAAAGIAYGLARWLPPAATLAAGCVLAAVALVVRQDRERWAAATAVVTIAGVGIAGVLITTDIASTVDTVIGLFGALLCAAAIALMSAPRGSLRAPRSSRRPPSDFDADPTARWHAIALALAAVGVALGEGAAFVGAGLLLATLLWRRGSIDWVAVRRPDLWHALLTLGVWLSFGILAWVAGRHGLLSPRELGRLGPLLVTPVFAWSAASLPRRGLEWAATAFVLAMALSGLIAIGQYIANPAEDSWWLQPISIFSAGMQTRVPGDAHRMVGGGFYFHRLKLAHVLLLVLGLLAARQMFATPSPRRRIGELVVSAICATALFVTFTRGAMLGAVAGAGALIAVAGRRWRIAGGAAAAVLIVAALSIPTVRARLMTIGTRQAASDRAVIWGLAVEQIENHPAGMGLGNYPEVIASVYDEKAPGLPLPKTYAHNVLLSAWAETGPGGALAYVLFWVSLMVAGWRAARLRGSPDHATAGATLLFAAVSLWTVGMTHDVLYHKPVALAFYAVIGTALGWLCRNDAGASASYSG